MNKYKICVYAVCMNQSKWIEEWVQRVSSADCVLALDCGSTDDTVQKLRDNGVLVYEHASIPLRFDVARNELLNKIPSDIQICVALDLNEFIEENWRKKLENIWDESKTHGTVILQYDENRDDGLLKVQEQVRIHTRNDFSWIYPVDEKIVPHTTGLTSMSTDFVIDVRQQSIHSRYNKLTLLKLEQYDIEKDPFILFLLGREYKQNRNWLESIDSLIQFLESAKGLYLEEQKYAMYYIAHCYNQLKDLALAKKWLYQSLAVDQNKREPYLYLARLAYQNKEWPLIIMLCDLGLRIKNKPHTNLVDLDAWGYLFDDYLALSYYYLEVYDKSLEHIQKALQFSPHQPRLLNTLQLVQEQIIL